jgi:hypothetical protein
VHKPSPGLPFQKRVHDRCINYPRARESSEHAIAVGSSLRRRLDATATTTPATEEPAYPNPPIVHKPCKSPR